MNPMYRGGGAGRVGIALAMLVTALAVHAGAESGSRPFWTEQAMFRFGDDLYFVGVASCAKTSEEGRHRAFEAGMKELGDYARERDTSRLLVETAMIYEEPNAGNCTKGSTSVWRLLRVNHEKILALSRRESSPDRQDTKDVNKSRTAPTLDAVGSAPSPPIQDLTPQAGMNREAIAQRFGKPKVIRKQDTNEIWEYSDTGLTITFTPTETLVSWHLSGKPDRPSDSPRPADLPKAAEPSRPPAAEKPPADAAQAEAAKPIVLPPPIPLSNDPVAEGRALFNGKGGCNTCHGRDADMYTDVKQDVLFGTTPGYIPPLFGPFGGPSPRRVAPNLRKWSTLKLRTDLDLARAIKDGIGGSVMTGTQHLSDAEISDLVAYLNSIR